MRGFTKGVVAIAFQCSRGPVVQIWKSFRCWKSVLYYHPRLSQTSYEGYQQFLGRFRLILLLKLFGNFQAISGMILVFFDNFWAISYQI